MRADALITQRSLKMITLLAKEDIPVMGQLGLVPRKSCWTGGLRAVGKTFVEANELNLTCTCEYTSQIIRYPSFIS